MSKRYVLCPGWVTSKNDGDRHYITAEQLAQLYGVPMAECLVYAPQKWWPASLLRREQERCQELTRLEPRYDGDYRLPDA